MSTWEQATQPLTRAQRARLHPVEQPANAGGGMAGPGPEMRNEAPQRDVLLKCPLPLVQAQPDSLRQFYLSGIPQSRIIIPSQ